MTRTRGSWQSPSPETAVPQARRETASRALHGPEDARPVHRAVSLLTDMVNRPSYKDYTVLENLMYSSKGLVQTLTMISITAGIRRKTLQPGAELDEEVLQEILPEQAAFHHSSSRCRLTTESLCPSLSRPDLPTSSSAPLILDSVGRETT
ncbi:unnamed protein product [Lampetra planeri]